MIYLDHAATTRMCPEALEAMRPFLEGSFGNPSAIYTFAGEAKAAIDEVRETLAASIGARPDEIFFTSGGTEADNWAIFGTAFANRERGRHIITSQIEHHAVLHPLARLEDLGFTVTYVAPDAEGRISPEAIEEAIRPDTILVSVMYANNEVGTTQPVAEIGEICKKHGVLFHTDAVQAYGHVPIDVQRVNIDLLSVSGHKMGGPKGIGFLYMRKHTNIASYLLGGAQERQMRAGTENVPGIVGLGCAASVAVHHLEREQERVTALRERMISRLLEEIPDIRINGSRKDRLPGNVNVTIQGVSAETLLVLLDLAGICASAGSACAAGSIDPSHVLLAMGLTKEEAKSTIRLSMGAETTEEEIEKTCDILRDLVQKLRA
ncbi:MAG: cysteine desulfurase [Lachnospiraceae bacterium]|nr:cysteine desulfurase [Lachnospiraceae bacterium]